MFMFSNENVYSAPIRVGSLPTSIDQVLLGAIFRNA